MRIGVLGCCLALVAGACSGGTAASVEPEAVKVAADVVPAELLGWRTQPEDVSKPLKEAKGKAYVSDVKLWSIREGDRLRATVEVGRFSPDAPPGEEFQRKVADQVGQAAPRVRRIGDQLVYVSAGNRQTYYMWFRGIHFVLLGVPADAVRPRALLRETIDRVTP